jgi:predicted secreted protein
MAGQRGRDVLISIGDGGDPEGFTVVAGVRAKTISLMAGLVEATTAESPQAWRELIAEAATKRAEMALESVLDGAFSGAGGAPDAASHPGRNSINQAAAAIARAAKRGARFL